MRVESIRKPPVDPRFPTRVAIKPELYKLLAHQAIEEGVRPNDYLNRLLSRAFDRPDLAVPAR